MVLIKATLLLTAVVAAAIEVGLFKLKKMVNNF